MMTVTATDLQSWMDAAPLPDIRALLRSGREIGLRRFLRQESRLPDPITPTLSCWAPNKPTLLFDGEPTWAELVIVRLLEPRGWSGRWVKNWTGGCESCVDVGNAEPMPEAAAAMFVRIDNRAASRTGGGAWDVFAWRGHEYLFIESKQHRSGDALRPGQLAWLDAALAEGVDDANFAVVEYDAGRPSTRAATLDRGSIVMTRAPSPQLALVLADVEAASPMSRIDERDRVAQFGGVAVSAMERWLDEEHLTGFAIGVLGVLAGEDDGAKAVLQRYIRRGGEDSRLASAAVNRLENRRTSRTRHTGLELDIYMSTGKPEAEIAGGCQVLVNGRLCANPGRHLLEGIVTCTTHRKSMERAAVLRRGGHPGHP
jgi:hypothetical protein